MASEVQVNRLAQEKLERSLQTSQLIYVCGFASVGKTTLVQNVLKNSDYVYTYVNCCTIATSSALFIKICRSLSDKLQSKRKLLRKIPDKVMGAQDCADFCDELKTEVEKENRAKIFVVLDEVDLLQKTALMDSLYALLTCSSINLILISRESPDQMCMHIKNSTMTIRFRDRCDTIEMKYWEKQELVEVILQQEPTDHVDLYRKFVHNVVNILYIQNTRDFRELRKFCQTNFDKFIEYHNKRTQESAVKNTPSGDRKSRRGLSRATNETHENPAYIMNIINSFIQNCDELKVGHLSQSSYSDLDKKCNFGTSILIVAAYICGHTTPACDIRNFVKLQKKKMKLPKIKEVENSKIFTLERMLQVFRSLAQLAREDENFNELDFRDSILRDVRLLEELTMLKIVTGDGLDTSTRYKISSILTREYVERIAKQCYIELQHFVGL